MSNKQGPIKQLLLSSSYWTLSKPLVYKFGLEAAFLLCNFAEAENLSIDGWFYQTIETVQEKTTLSRRKQDKAINLLEGLGVLYSDVRGVPAKRYFKIDYNQISLILFGESVQTSMSETSKLECAKRTTNKELNNKELNNKDIYSSAKAKQEIPYKEIIDYLNKKTNKNYKHTANGNRRLIKARWNEGSTLEDFKKVIDVKVEQWENDNTMKQYLRPSTLFDNKFDGYLNEESKTNNKKIPPQKIGVEF